MPENRMLAKELINRGYRPVILALAADGLGAHAIGTVLEEEYGLNVSRKSLSHWISKKIGDLEKFQDETLRRELAELHQDALDAIKHFRDGMREAESLPDMIPGKGGQLVPNTYRLDLMKFYQSSWRDWWDRVSKIHGIGTPKHSTTNFISGGDQSINPVQVIMEEMQKGVLDADTLSNIADRLERD